MKKTVGWGLLGFLILGFIGAQEEQDKSINWYTDYPEAMKMAKEMVKPVLIFFYAPWSQPSRLMLSDVWAEPNIVDAAEKFICISINVDTYHYDTGHKVHTYPTLVISDPGGREIYRRSGFVSAEDLLPLMKVFPVNFVLIDELKRKIEIDEKDIESLQKLAQIYSQIRVWDMSTEYYKEVLKIPDINFDEELKDVVIFSLAMNQIRLKRYEEAEKALEEELKEYPRGKSTEKILYAIFVAEIGQRKIDEAEKTLKKLKTKYPDSEMTEHAVKILESIKKHIRQP